MAIKRSLPPESQLWGRDIEKRLADMEAQQGNFPALIGSSNSRLSAVLRSQQQLTVQQASLNSQQTLLEQQVAFLSGQTSYNSSDGALYAYFVSAASTVTNYEVPYDPLRSATITFTTSNTGVIAVEAQCSWSVFPPINTYFGIDWTMYVEILQDTTVIKGRSTGAPQVTLTRVLCQPSLGSAFTASEGLSTSSVVTLTPNTTYTARTRLFVNTLQTSNDLTVSPMTLKITKLGM